MRPFFSEASELQGGKLHWLPRFYRMPTNKFELKTSANGYTSLF